MIFVIGGTIILIISFIVALISLIREQKQAEELFRQTSGHSSAGVQSPPAEHTDKTENMSLPPAPGSVEVSPPKEEVATDVFGEAHEHQRLAALDDMSKRIEELKAKEESVGQANVDAQPLQPAQSSQDQVPLNDMVSNVMPGSDPLARDPFWWEEPDENAVPNRDVRIPGMAGSPLNQGDIVLPPRPNISQTPQDDEVSLSGGNTSGGFNLRDLVRGDKKD